MTEDRNEDINIEENKKTNQNKKLELVGNIAFIIFMIIILSLIFITVQSKLTGQEPTLFNHRLYIVDSGSMSPTIKLDSMIIVKESQPSEINAGDVITYYGHNTSSRVTHRVMEVIDNGKSFTTRGDANESNDPLALEGEKLIGRVVFAIPAIGRVFRFLGTKVGMSLLVTIAIAWIAIPKLLPKDSKENS